jgi:hypothetical protein
MTSGLLSAQVSGVWDFDETRRKFTGRIEIPATIVARADRTAQRLASAP